MDKIPVEIIDDIKNHISSGIYDFSVLYTLRRLMGFQDEIISLVGEDDLMTIDLVTSELGFQNYPNISDKSSLDAETIAKKERAISRYMAECEIMDMFKKIVAANERS